MAFLEYKILALKSKNTKDRQPPPWHIQAMFDHDLAQLACELDWLKELIHLIETDAHLLSE